MFKKPKFLTSFLVTAYAFTISVYAMDYTNTSFYVNYDSEDPTQFALVMPSVNKVYTHKAGEIQPSDLTQVDGELASFPTYTNGELCFPALKSGASGLGGASKMAGNCYDVHFFYVQKEIITEGAAFMLYYDIKDKVQEGLAGKSQTFQTVKEGDTITNANSITGEDYTYFRFDHATATVSIGDEGAKVTGVAVDDLILNGLVEARDVNHTLLASGRTSMVDGSYTLDVAHNGVVVINVSCDTNSKLYNPVTDTNMTCGTDVKLNSIASVETGTPVTVNISPLTQIVYQRAQTQAGGDIAAVTANELDDARSEVGLLFGVDPIADSPVEGIAADIIGAIHTLADEDNTTSVIDVTNALAKELSDGSADGSTDATVSALTEVMDDANITNNLTDNNGTYTPPEDPADLSDIEEAKALFAELRTQAMSVVDYNNSGTPGFMDTEAVDMEAAMNDVTMNVGYMVDRLNGIVEAIDYMVDNNIPTLTGQPSQNRSVTVTAGSTEGTWTYVIKEDSVEKWNGSVSIPAVLLGDDAAAELYTSGTLTMTVDGTVPLDYEAVIEEGVTDSQSFEGEISVTKTATGADISLSGEVASNGTSIALTEATATLGYTESAADIDGNTEPEFDYFKLHNIVLQGIVGGYTIDGSISVNSYAQNAGLAPKGGFEETLMKIANSGWLPDDITFAGAISRTGASMEGTLHAKWLNVATMDMESEDAMPLVEVAFNGKLQMPERPEMLATLTFENNATHNMIGASYTYDRTVIINLSALFDTDMNNGDIEVTTHTGLRADLKVTDGDLITDGTGTVTKDGKILGTLQERMDVPVIKYVDGSFESLP